MHSNLEHFGRVKRSGEERSGEEIGGVRWRYDVHGRKEGTSEKGKGKERSHF